MNTSTKTPLSVLLATLLIPFAAGVLSADAPEIGTPHTWVSNPAYAKQLATEVKVDEFSVSPPAGYRLEKALAKTDNYIRDEFKWVGPKRADGSVPKLIVAVFTSLSGPSDRTAEEGLLGGLNAMNTGGRRYVHTPVEHGRLNGMDFVRAYWKRDPTQSNVKTAYHGFQYASSQDSSAVTVLGEDIAPHYKSTIDLMEATALTLHQ